MSIAFVFGLIAIGLIFTGILSVRSESVNRYKNKYYLFGVAINIIILASEAIGYMVYGYLDNILYYILKIVVFVLAPLLPYALLLMNRPGFRKKEQILLIPVIINGVIGMLSPWLHTFFYVDSQNMYHRGLWFFLSFVIGFSYIIMGIIDMIKIYVDLDHKERHFLYFLCGFMVVGVGIQIFNIEFITMWPVIGIGMIIYYIFIVELNGKYDSLTGARNRNAFEKRKESLKDNKDYTLVVMDINGVKITNDAKGHAEGDLLIMDASQIMIKNFARIGTVYRFGGDEFCVVCEDKTTKQVGDALFLIKYEIIKMNQNRAIPLTIAFGSKRHKVGSNTGFEEIFHSADAMMYKMKKEFYKEHREYDRRADR